MYTNIIYNPYAAEQQADKCAHNCAHTYRLVAPPPNVTGDLHIGHVFNLVLQRVINIEKEQRGMRAQCVIGLDHAGIAAKYVLTLRHGFVSVKAFWSWKRRVGQRVLLEIRRVLGGHACGRARFTLDFPFSVAVASAFSKFYREKLVTKKSRLLWWDRVLNTTVSKLEMSSSVSLCRLLVWRFAFKSGELIAWNCLSSAWAKSNYLCSVRAYAHMHARYIIISLAEVSLCKLTSAKLIDTISGNEVSLIINVGAFEVCACTCICVYTHTRVPLTLAATASPFIHALIAKNALICVSKLTYTNINYSLRTGAKLCHKLTNQWLFNLRALLRYCDITRVRVEPSRWKHTLLAWASNLGYWCVSRVMDWGHALPIWKLNGLLSVRDTKAKALYYLILSAAAPLVLCGISKLVSSESLVFDTWFSSSLWCLSCLGWPNKTRELRLCVSASAVLTGYDIMFFWVLKMLLVSCFFVKGRLLFKNVIIHPIVCDALGQKMSKTKNNVINPKALFNSFGLEPVRLYFSGVDLSLQRFKMCLNTLLACRNISTKLWNIRRTIARRTSLSCVCYSLFCKWATTSLFVRIKRVAVALRTLNLNVYLNELLDAIKFDLNNCVALSQCACVVRLYDLVCWHYRAVLMRINTARFLNTRYNSAFVITLVVIHLLTLVSTANIVCTNCKRLFQQARPPAYTLMRSSVVYFNKIRVSACWQVFLWYGGLFVWR